MKVPNVSFGDNGIKNIGEKKYNEFLLISSRRTTAFAAKIRAKAVYASTSIKVTIKIFSH